MNIRARPDDRIGKLHLVLLAKGHRPFGNCIVKRDDIQGIQEFSCCRSQMWRHPDEHFHPCHNADAWIFVPFKFLTPFGYGIQIIDDNIRIENGRYRSPFTANFLLKVQAIDDAITPQAESFGSLLLVTFLQKIVHGTLDQGRSRYVLLLRQTVQCLDFSIRQLDYGLQVNLHGHSQSIILKMTRRNQSTKTRSICRQSPR
jgi:hypothetical protein